MRSTAKHRQIAFKVPTEIYNRLERNPGVPKRGAGRTAFYQELFLAFVDSAEFRVKELEAKIRHMELQKLVYAGKKSNLRHYRLTAYRTASVSRKP